MHDHQPLIILRQVTSAHGPPADPLMVLADTTQVVVGRSEDADWCLTDPRTSRKHAIISVIGETVLIRDLGSRHGTAVNDRQLATAQDTPIMPGDSVRFGAVICRAHRGGSIVSAPTILDDSTRVSVVAPGQVGGLERARLAALIEASKRLAKASSRAEIAEVLVESISSLPECSRVGILRPIAEEDYEMIASSTTESDGLKPSRSLLREAANGRLVQLAADTLPQNDAHSIVSMGVRSAVCVPVRVGNEVDSLVYVDTRGNERTIDSDVMAFCDALGAVAGLAIERVSTEESEAQRRGIELDLQSARDAQRMLFPPHKGTVSGTRYVYESIPGRLVGGDLFDVFALDGDRTAFFLGDAVGKGAGAGVLMVTVQTLLRNLLESGVGLGDALSRTNASLSLRSASNKFVTLMAGIWEPSRGVLQVVDAGHGLVLLDHGRGFEQCALQGGIPLGIQLATTYAVQELDFSVETRLFAFSDGVSEQPNLEGEQFGVDRVLSCLNDSLSPESDINRVIDAVRKHAATDSDFGDDLTVASLTFSVQNR